MALSMYLSTVALSESGIGLKVFVITSASDKLPSHLTIERSE